MGTLMDTQYQIRIFGRVQGVGFRAAARRQARSLRLRGWVENNPDGSVTAVVKGDLSHCTRFINWCREGTGYSWVERVELQEMETEALGHFEIRY
jgi:acylphosphatase